MVWSLSMDAFILASWSGAIGKESADYCVHNESANSQGICHNQSHRVCKLLDAIILNRNYFCTLIGSLAGSFPSKTDIKNV